MLTRPLVSVIIPIYNVEQYLKTCVNSVLNQTYDNLEIILVDDGSTDKSPIICDDFKHSDRRIIVIHKANGGLSDARNAGIDICNGNYIFFLDADDYIHCETISRMMELSLKEIADIVECGVLQIPEFDNNAFYGLRFSDNYEVFAHNEAVKGILDYKFKIMAWNKLYRTSLFKDIRFPVGKIHEDEYTIPYVIEKCNKYVLMKDPMYAYVQRTNSIMNSAFSDKHLTLLDAHEERLKYFSKKYSTKYNDIIIYHYFVACLYLMTFMEKRPAQSEVVKKKKLLFKKLLFGKSPVHIKIKAIIYAVAPSNIRRKLFNR